MLHGQAAEDEPRRLRVVALALAFAVTCAGCASLSTIRQKIVGPTPDSQPRATELGRRDDPLAREGQPPGPRDLSARAVGEAGTGDVHAAALYHLARVYVDPSSGLRDYRMAQATFERLLAEHPDSVWSVEARAWRATLSDMFQRQVEAARLKDEISKLRSALTARQAESARFREEASRLKADLQRLKQLDLDLERRP